MKKIWVAFAALAATFSLMADDKVEVEDSTEGFEFTDVKVIETTPVKDQNKSGTCWCFAGISFIVVDILWEQGVMGDLSEMFVVRLCYLDKADRYVRLGGNTNFAQGGSLIDVPHVWEKLGAMPEEFYTGLEYGEDKHVHGELQAVLEAYLKGVVSNPNKRLSTAWRKGFEAILDAYLGKVPETFTYNGKTYTPRSYAQELDLKMKDYEAYTSFTHHPFYKEFPLEVPDNWLWAAYKNVKLDELKAIVDNSIEKGYTVVWAADVSEGGFKWREGYAVMPEEIDQNDMDGTELSRWVHLSDSERADQRYDFDEPVPEIKVTQEMRQQMFDRMETTDDHGMVIVGTAVDQKGNRYYKVKNSWDTNQVYDGFFYVSEPYFLAKTMSILVNRNAVPSDISKKFQK